MAVFSLFPQMAFPGWMHIDSEHEPSLISLLIRTRILLDQGTTLSSVQSLLCLTHCDPMDCSTPGFPVHHQLPRLLKLMSVLVMLSNHLILCCPFCSCPQSLSASGSFPTSRFFTAGGQSIGVSASASFLPVHTQD